ncbi:MAG: EF-P beta-lysylation protein EpmB [Pirellulales bacterium]|nr:EF-P beta-lysylation protein EpmB [Pirellulales bacterium]
MATIDLQPGSWQSTLARAVRDPVALCRAVGLPESLAAPAGDLLVLVPEPYLARIRPGDPRDPLLLQVLPRPEEHEETPGFTTDPLGESAHLGEQAALAGCRFLSKYANRSLILTSPHCAVHCRFCFRRHALRAQLTVGSTASPLPLGEGPGMRAGGASHDPSGNQTGTELPPALTRRLRRHPLPEGEGRDDGLSLFDAALEHLAADRTIHEVILSGGDPLTLEDSQLAALVDRLAGLEHLRRLRVHTRMPIVLPQRVTSELMAWLRGTRLSPVVVVHVNHPAEIDAAVADALDRLVDAGVPVLSQSVLLRDVNDTTDTLAALFERLVDLRVLPYYLHQLDRVAGAAHFEVPEPTGIALMNDLRRRLPGYAVPRYVREVAGAQSKVILG